MQENGQFEWERIDNDVECCCSHKKSSHLDSDGICLDKSNLKGSIAFTDGIYDEDEKISAEIIMLMPLHIIFIIKKIWRYYRVRLSDVYFSNDFLRAQTHPDFLLYS
ncbi:MAG: hypothetical protein WAJ93_23120 [Candidatus Nitrosopolaris sp.]